MTAQSRDELRLALKSTASALDFADAFYEHFGPYRLFHQLAHDLVFAMRGLGGFLGKYGTVPASHQNAERALDLSLRHAASREQFGRVIGTYQAVLRGARK